MDQDYYRHMAKIQDDHWWYEGRRNIIRSLISRLDLPDNIKILEAGCGTGANLGMLKSLGSASAFEPDDFARETAKKTTNCRVENGSLPGEIPFDETFDLVCAFDVIEHIEQDAESLQALYDLTGKGGYGVFTVPAFQFLWSRHDEINHHKRRYNKRQFASVLRQSGYEIEFISYYNSWLFPVAVIVRTIKKALKREDDSDVKMPESALVNKLLTMIFSSEKFVLKFMPLPVGLSLIAICKKTGQEQL